MIKKLYYGSAALLLLLPLAAVLYLSVQQQWAYPQLLSGFTLQHWQRFLSPGSGLGGSLLLSLAIATGIAATATAFGVVVSAQLLGQQRQSRLLKLAYYPYLIAPVVFGAMLQFYFARLGLMGTVGGVMLAQLLFACPYSVLLMSTFWNDRVRQTLHQATTLGASPWQLYRTVLLPMAKPWAFLCFVQCFLISWYEYGITQLIGVGKVKTLTVAAMLFVREADPHLAALCACLMVAPPIALLLVGRFLIFANQSIDTV